MAYTIERIWLGSFATLLALAGCGGTNKPSSVDSGGMGGAGGLTSLSNTGGTNSSSATTSGTSPIDATLFDGEPRCLASEGSIFRLRGTLGGADIADDRATTGGFSQGTNGGDFDSPQAGLKVSAGQTEIHFSWATLVTLGAQAPITGGTIMPPSTHVLAGQTLCTTKGVMGFVHGGAEDDALKFRITEAVLGADCSGAAVVIDVRGCFN